MICLCKRRLATLEPGSPRQVSRRVDNIDSTPARRCCENNYRGRHRVCEILMPVCVYHAVRIRNATFSADVANVSLYEVNFGQEQVKFSHARDRVELATYYTSVIKKDGTFLNRKKRSEAGFEFYCTNTQTFPRRSDQQ